MRFQFKTSYNQDIRLFKDRGDVGWYGGKLDTLVFGAAQFGPYK